MHSIIQTIKKILGYFYGIKYITYNIYYSSWVVYNGIDWWDMGF